MKVFLFQSALIRDRGPTVLNMGVLTVDKLDATPCYCPFDDPMANMF